MYNQSLDTFIRAAELGSFSKVAAEYYISPSAVIQQINHLEANLNVRLFNRGKKGVTLTPAGEYLLVESRSLVQRCSDIRTHLASFTEHTEGAVLFASNRFHMPNLIYDYWPDFSISKRGCRLSSYYFSENGSDIPPDTDIIEGVFFKEPLWQRNFIFYPVTNVRLALLVSESSPLAANTMITEQDLQNVIVVSILRDISDSCDQMSDSLTKSGIVVEEAMIYSTSVMIDCMESGKAVIIPDCWKDFHPRSRLVPFIRNFQLPYGFFLSKGASTAARQFASHVMKHFGEESQRRFQQGHLLSDRPDRRKLHGRAGIRN